jgi:CoA:oxalate CoA-transferase
MGGVMSLTGQPGGEPTRVGSSIGDMTAGMFTAIGINAALFHREKTGEGQKIDVAMLDSQVAILENAIARYSATGEVPGPLGARHPSITPFDAFKAADSHIVIAAGNDSLFSILCETIGQTGLAESPLFKTNLLRTENCAVLKEKLEKALNKKTVAEWNEAFDKAGVPSGPINKVDQVLTDPQVLSRNMVVTATDKITGPLKMAGNPIKMSAFDDPTTRLPAPELDADREKILRELISHKHLV